MSHTSCLSTHVHHTSTSIIQSRSGSHFGTFILTVKCLEAKLWDYIWCIYMYIWCIYIYMYIYTYVHLGDSTGKNKKENPPASAGAVRYTGLIPGSGRSPGGGHSNPCQYSCLENPMDRGAWRATVHGVTHNRTWLKWLSMWAQMYILKFQSNAWESMLSVS